jgi:hypothetical protein
MSTPESIRIYPNSDLIASTEPTRPNRLKPDEQTQPLSRKQRRFLDACLNSTSSFSDLLTEHHLNGARLATWLMQFSFRKELLRIRRTLGKQREMELALGAKRGAEFLNRAVTEKSDVYDRNLTARCRAAETLVSLARAAEILIRHEKKPPFPPQRDLSHPDNPHAETLRLLEELEGNQPAD